GKKALFVYGRNSIKKNGVYEAIVKTLKENKVDFIEHAGVKPNPVLSHAREGIKTAKKENIEVIIAAGGGSVIDEAKAIAAGAKHGGDAWDFFIGKAGIKDALPVVTALTLPATGSEMNSGFVITNEETKQKYSAGSSKTFPKVSILDPETTMSLPEEQTAYGAVDALAHILEGYFTTKDSDCAVTDELVEALARSIIVSADRIIKNPKDYDARASMMWSATLALNGLPVCGYAGVDFINHAIEHSLSAIYDIPHGAGLAIVIPAYLKYCFKKGNHIRTAKFAEKVLKISAKNPEQTAQEGIETLKKWFRQIGAPISLKDVKIPEADIPQIAENAMGLVRLWGMRYSKKTIEEILSHAI
ncbi:MAG: iron-containing alcohol dehydrogenase, partial [Elusimicrobia bacterium]|nr:iron-containing alcohol dehydrogenase [Elusimicrobiota bacterium]